MNNRRGDVVILDYPFSDSSGAKVRPALVVQTDQRNAILTNTIVALIGDQTLTGTDTVSGITGRATVTVGPGP